MNRGTPVWTQVWLLTRRELIRGWRTPVVVIPNLFISVFFLLVYDGAFGGSGPIKEIVGGNYVNFTLPVAIITASFSGAASGFSLVEDMESGYLRRLLGMPLSRAAIVGGPMLHGAIQVVLQSVLMIGLGYALGARSATGVLGLLPLIAMAFLWGMAFAGYSVATGVRTGNAQAAQAATFVFFPLVFLSSTFVPKQLLKGWMQTAATVNPATYVLDGMRSLLINGWRAGALLKGFAAAGGFALLMLVWAAAEGRRVTSRG